MPSIIFDKRRLLSLCGLIMALLIVPAITIAAPVLHHDIVVDIDPARHALQARDALTWSAPPGALEFVLHADLEPRVEGKARLTRLDRGEYGIPFERYRLILPDGARSAVLHYGGVIHHPLSAYGEGTGHDREVTPGLIAPEGVMLSASSGWYPRFAAYPRHAFTLTARLPTGWEAVSQGSRTEDRSRVRWRENAPQEDIYLIAGRFTRYQRGTEPAAMVYLRTPDAHLAERYLAATERYLAFYTDLLGPYPYAKFALVENFWETGYGMPSFTLLGPQVIRLPFIIDNAYPHEIVHNWWGNGVYIDPALGNWSEGLTAYLTDHLLKEQTGHGSEYRRDQLQAYAAYVSDGRDFPLTQFRGRHSGASQAVGYGKGMMFFHMLRRELGDERFTGALRRFYGEARFHFADFDDLRGAFEVASGKNLQPFFAQWLQRTGAPRLELADTTFSIDHLMLTLHQTQADAPFALNVPIVVALQDGTLVERSVTMKDRSVTVNLPMPGAPVCVAVDPRFDIFRRLLPGELPAAIANVLGAERVLFVVPSAAPEPLRHAYGQLAQSWSAGMSGAEMREDRALRALPTDRPVVLLGWENRHLDALSAPLPGARDRTLRLEKRQWSRADHSFVLAVPHRQTTLLWLGSDDPAAIAALARKVPHYGKFSYLAFEGAAAVNRLKGQWPAVASPLLRTSGSAACQPAPRAPLATFARD